MASCLFLSAAMLLARSVAAFLAFALSASLGGKASGAFALALGREGAGPPTLRTGGGFSAGAGLSAVAPEPADLDLLSPVEDAG